MCPQACAPLQCAVEGGKMACLPYIFQIKPAIQTFVIILKVLANHAVHLLTFLYRAIPTRPLQVPLASAEPQLLS